MGVRAGLIRARSLIIKVHQLSVKSRELNFWRFVMPEDKALEFLQNIRHHAENPGADRSRRIPEGLRMEV